MEEAASEGRFAQLVEQHYTLLYRYAYRLSGSEADAEDLTQQTFLTAQRKFNQLREEQAAKAWLFSILRNTYLKQLHKQNKTAGVSLERIAEPAGEPELDRRLDSEELQQALDELPNEFRDVLILFYFDEFSYKEIADLLDVPIGTVMSRLARGKRHLRDRLGRPAAAKTKSEASVSP